MYSTFIPGWLTKQLFGLCVDQDDLSLLVDDNDRVRCCLQQTVVPNVRNTWQAN